MQKDKDEKLANVMRKVEIFQQKMTHKTETFKTKEINLLEKERKNEFNHVVRIPLVNPCS